MSPRRVLVVLAASAAFAVSGCAAKPDHSVGPDIQVLPSVQVSFEPPLSRSPAAGGETLTGTVVEGVEPGCLVLRSSAGPHVLLFDDPALKSKARTGAQVTVSGRSMPGQATTCQQGVAFVVTAVHAN
jgi:hypothetical protein